MLNYPSISTLIIPTTKLIFDEWNGIIPILKTDI